MSQPSNLGHSTSPEHLALNALWVLMDGTGKTERDVAALVRVQGILGRTQPDYTAASEWLAEASQERRAIMAGVSSGSGSHSLALAAGHKNEPSDA